MPLLEARLVEITQLLLQQPHGGKSRFERPPKHTELGKTEFRKLEFNVPKLSGAISEGRLLYFYHPDANEIQLLMIYTHKDYPGRPSEDELRALFQEAGLK